MQEIWTRFLKWLQVNAPHLIEYLNAGVSTNDLETLEKSIGKPLPIDFVEFYKIHDGQNREPGPECLIDAEELLSTENIVFHSEKWKSLVADNTFIYFGVPATSDPDIGVKDDWWNPFWLPFTHDGSGNHICIDLDPTSDGQYGQIIRMWHDTPWRELLAPSFKEFILNYLIGLENGKFVYSKDWGLVDKDSAFNEP